MNLRLHPWGLGPGWVRADQSQGAGARGQEEAAWCGRRDGFRP